MRADSVEWSWLDDWKNVSKRKFQSGRLVPEKGPSGGNIEDIEEKKYTAIYAEHSLATVPTNRIFPDGSFRRSIITGSNVHHEQRRGPLSSP